MFSHKNKKYSLRKVKNGVASVVIALLFASVTAPVAQARSVVGDGGDSAQVSSLGTTVLLSSGGFGTVHDGDPLLGGSGESESGKHDENSCPRPWGKVGDPAGEVCPRDGHSPSLSNNSEVPTPTPLTNASGSQNNNGRYPSLGTNNGDNLPAPSPLMSEPSSQASGSEHRPSLSTNGENSLPTPVPAPLISDSDTQSGNGGTGSQRDSLPTPVPVPLTGESSTQSGNGGTSSQGDRVPAPAPLTNGTSTRTGNGGTTPQGSALPTPMPLTSAPSTQAGNGSSASQGRSGEAPSQGGRGASHGTQTTPLAFTGESGSTGTGVSPRTTRTRRSVSGTTSTGGSSVGGQTTNTTGNQSANNSQSNNQNQQSSAPATTSAATNAQYQASPKHHKVSKSITKKTADALQFVWILLLVMILAIAGYLVSKKTPTTKEMK